MASRKFLGVVLLYALFVACVKADAEADAEADPEADPAGCCSRPTTFVKGKNECTIIIGQGNAAQKKSISSTYFSHTY